MKKRKKGAQPDGAAAAPEAADAAAAAAAGGGKKTTLLAAIVVAVAVLGGGAMAGGVIGGGGAPAAAAVPAPEPTPTPTALGALVELEALTINLADGHFLKIGVAVELGPEVVEEPPTAPVLDVMIEEFSPRTLEQLSDPVQRQATKDSLLARLEPIYGGDVVAVYYTEFVMQ